MVAKEPKLKAPAATGEESVEMAEEKLESQIVVHATSCPKRSFTASGDEVNKSDIGGMWDVNAVKWEGGSLDLQSTIKLPRNVYKKGKCHNSLGLGTHCDADACAGGTSDAKEFLHLVAMFLCVVDPDTGNLTYEEPTNVTLNLLQPCV